QGQQFHPVVPHVQQSAEHRRVPREFRHRHGDQDRPLVLLADLGERSLPHRSRTGTQDQRPADLFGDPRYLLATPAVNTAALQPHDSRMTSSVSSTTVCGGPVFPARRSNSICAASRPISSPGWLTTVSPGVTNPAQRKSSKPVSATSAGTLSPSSFAASIT